ncbi:hypothetical protein ACFQDD_00570 [Halorubrum pallidum]|uniref:Uncharacterized protein n=1 Tax=Halorubrum pallidum TaxID=1526114 RepID=A0ABD5SY88_9EURY
MRSCAERARHSDTIVAVDTRRQARALYQKTEKNETWTVATTPRSRTPSETSDELDHEDRRSAQRRLEPQTRRVDRRRRRRRRCPHIECELALSRDHLRR